MQHVEGDWGRLYSERSFGTRGACVYAMTNRLVAWRMLAPGEPLTLTESALPTPGDGEVLLKVAACGLCHTDVGFLYEGVRPNAGLPLTLGHEIIGTVVEAGPGCKHEVGETLLVPAVLPCGECELCRAGRGNVCRNQKMPGNDFDGGFASHFLAPERFLCPVPGDTPNLEDLSVVADAVGTAFQAVERAAVGEDQMAIIVGSGGVGTFAVQSAKIAGAKVAAIDVDPNRLEAVAPYVDLALDATQLNTKEIRGAIAAFEKEHGIPKHGRRIIECSGDANGQATAYALLNHDARLAVVGFTMDKLPLRLSNLMAFDAVAFGNWGCLPELFPEILKHIAAGRLCVEPYVQRHPMSALNDLLKEGSHAKRPVLIPDF